MGYAIPREPFETLVEFFQSREKAETFAHAIEEIVEHARVESEKQIGQQKAQIKAELLDELVTKELFEAHMARIDERFKQIDERFKQVDERFKQIDERFKQVDERFKQIDERFNAVDERFKGIDYRFQALEARIDKLAYLVKVLVAVNILALSFFNPIFVDFLKTLLGH